MDPQSSSQLYIFGGSSPWFSEPSTWIAVDDRVRGGASVSHLSPSPSSSSPNHQKNCAIFFGTLDVKTLGGAGFASQSTSGDKSWDLSGYEGLRVEVVEGDGKVYTVIVKDEGPEEKEKREDGREKAVVSWEYEFRAGKEESVVDIPWNKFKATYRGREKKDAKPLKTREIKRFSLMMRSFFGTQEGEFKLTLKSISAVKSEKNAGKPTSSYYDSEKPNSAELSNTGSGGAEGSQGWFSWLPGRCVML